MNGNASELPFLPQSASTLGDKFEPLFWYITAWTTLGTLVVCGGVALFCILYRRGATSGSTPRILGSHRLELGWTIVPLLIFLTFFAWGTVVYDYAVHVPEDAPEVYVIGKQWMWKAQYPNGQRVIIGGNPRNMTAEEQANIGALVLPVDRPTKVTFISEDVIHDFGIPAFRQKIDVVPGRYVSTFYHPTRVGTYHVFCDQYCGTWHSLMVGKIRVVPQAEFEAFLAGTTPAQGPGTGNAVDGSMAWEGQQLFRKLQCNACHTENAGAGTQRHPRAPSLVGLHGRTVPLKGGGSVVADESYIIESIVDPRAKVVEGWEPIMPGNYRHEASAEDINKVVAYIKSLKEGGKMIPPNERFPAPDGAPRVPPTTGPSGGSKLP